MNKWQELGSKQGYRDGLKLLKRRSYAGPSGMIGAYNEDDAELKQQFLKDGRSFMNDIGKQFKALGYTVSVRVNKTGPAVSGDVYGTFLLDKNGFHLILTASAMGSTYREDGVILFAQPIKNGQRQNNIYLNPNDSAIAIVQQLLKTAPKQEEEGQIQAVIRHWPLFDVPLKDIVVLKGETSQDIVKQMLELSLKLETHVVWWKDDDLWVYQGKRVTKEDLGRLLQQKAQENKPTVFVDQYRQGVWQAANYPSFGLFDGKETSWDEAIWKAGSLSKNNNLLRVENKRKGYIMYFYNGKPVLPKNVQKIIDQLGE